jgi:hypothetical protein
VVDEFAGEVIGEDLLQDLYSSLYLAKTRQERLAIDRGTRSWLLLLSLYLFLEVSTSACFLSEQGTLVGLLVELKIMALG